MSSSRRFLNKIEPGPTALQASDGRWVYVVEQSSELRKKIQRTTRETKLDMTIYKIYELDVMRKLRQERRKDQEIIQWEPVSQMR